MSTFKSFLRRFGLILVSLAILMLCVRGLMGISSVLTQKDFYPPAGRFLMPNEKSVKFVILSDTGSQNETLENLLVDSRTSENPDFVLHLGDLIVYRNIEHIYWMMNRLEKQLGDVPLYLIPGNHDVKKKKGIDKSFFQRVLGPTYYWFGYGDTLFIGLDSSTEEIDVEQWSFFEQVMKRVRPSFKHVVLFTHVPPIVPPEYPFHLMKEESVKRMAQMLKKYPVDVVFSGHVHYYSEQKFNGIPVYTVPPSGQYFVGPVRKFGYLVVEIDDKGVRVRNVYSEHPKRMEWLKVFFVDLFLTDKVRWIAGGIFCAGLLMWLCTRCAKKHK